MQTYLNDYWQRINKKTLGWVVAFSLLLLFGDSLLPIIGHFLHVLIEVVESALEHLLEAAFGLSPRQAQMVLFYSWLFITIYLTWQLLRKAYFTMLGLYETAVIRWQAWVESPKMVAWFRGMMMLSVFSASVYLFT